MQSDITAIHVVGDLHPRSGGTSRAVVELTNTLAESPGVSVTLLFQTLLGDVSLPSGPLVQRIEATVRSRWEAMSGLPLRKALGDSIAKGAPSIIHVHGLWLPLDHWAAAAARRWRTKLVIQPHGMLEPWSLHHGALKKRAAMMLYQRRDLRAADLLVGSTETECGSFRRLGLTNPVAVVPNGVQMDSISDDTASHIRDDASHMRTALFLSRLHPKKGLPNLIRAWARVAPQGWQLLIAGPDEGGHLQDVQVMISRLGLGQCVRYVGEVHDAAKSRIYRSADLFVLPTHSENFGIAVVEALAHGVPVITTRAAPWRELETHRCGWWIEVGEEPLVRALQEAMAASDDVRRQMGARGKALAQRYDWKAVSRQLAETYRWILAHGDRPRFVLM